MRVGVCNWPKISWKISAYWQKIRYIFMYTFFHREHSPVGSICCSYQSVLIIRTFTHYFPGGPNITLSTLTTSYLWMLPHCVFVWAAVSLWCEPSQVSNDSTPAWIRKKKKTLCCVFWCIKSVDFWRVRFRLPLFFPVWFWLDCDSVERDVPDPVAEHSLLIVIL